MSATKWIRKSRARWRSRFGSPLSARTLRKCLILSTTSAPLGEEYFALKAGSVIGTLT